ncbi:hypothetical protein RRG08_057122 [Elysia crispata]|uniref:Uncharacterized protein n=1 Tax=Elysia crispata TaxID=231223 RepID=A0AAE1AG97_9GAST|nr:hypothetical protein RRG08_057122 [Elysia crispata]
MPRLKQQQLLRQLFFLDPSTYILTEPVHEESVPVTTRIRQLQGVGKVSQPELVRQDGACGKKDGGSDCGGGLLKSIRLRK